MAETTNFEIDDLQFKRVHPGHLASRWDEIQALRQKYYEGIFRGKRTLPEIENYVSRLTVRSWVNPNEAVGKTARHGQKRWNPLVTAAIERHSDKLVGFMYAAENASSKIERALLDRDAFVATAGLIGALERTGKRLIDRSYVWGSEYVHSGERQGLVPVLAALTLEKYIPEKSGTWFPWEEETELKAQLGEWHYAWNGEAPHYLLGDEGFGLGASPTSHQLWVVPHIHDVIDTIELVPGTVEALDQARETMAA